PSAASSLIACGSVLIPTPSSRICSDCSNTSQSMPRACSINAVVRPPTPPPAMIAFMAAYCVRLGYARNRSGVRPSRIDRPAREFYFAFLLFRLWLSSPVASSAGSLFSLDAGFADHIAPARCLFLDESAHLRRCATAGTDAQRVKAIQQTGIAHRGIG